MDAHDPKDLHPQTMLGMKLIQQPFSKIPDAENLFDFDALKQTRDTVSHHLQFSNLLMVIQGRSGSGKNSFANSIIVDEHPALYFFNASAESDDNIKSLLLKAAANNNAESITVLEKRIDDIMFRGQQPVLIINDAERVRESELRELIKYAQSKKDSNQQTQLKLLLLGDHSIESKLNHNGILNHNQFYIIELPQLNMSNTRAFLMHRLTQAGFRDASPFSDKDISNIFSMANGNIVATMEYAAEALNNNKSLYSEEHTGNQKTKKTLIYFGVALFIAAFIYNSLLTEPDESSTTNNTKLEIPAVKNEMNNEKKAVDQLFSSSTNTMDIKQDEKAITLPPLVPELTETQNNHKIDAQNLIESSQLVNSKQVQPSTVETDAKAQNELPEKESLSETSSTSTPTTQTTSGIAKPDPEVEPKAPVETTISKSPLAPHTKTHPVVVQKTDKLTRSFMAAGAKPPSWLLQQPEENWSLQILGAYKPETLLSFIHQHRLGKKVSFFRSRLGNKDWYVILYGQYKSKEQAKGAIPYLPGYIRQNNPWAKDMKSVQNSIKQYKK